MIIQDGTDLRGMLLDMLENWAVTQITVTNETPSYDGQQTIVLKVAKKCTETQTATTLAEMGSSS